MRDLISREDAIEALRGLFDMRKSRAKVIVECFGELINALPSADAVHIEVYRDLYERYVDLKHTSDLVYRPSVDADCSTCKHKDKDWDSEECDSCCGNNNHYESADAEPMTEEVREALMRLAMCAREECAMCKYKGECDYDFQYNISTDNMNTLSDALMRSRCEVDAKSAEANHGLAKENSELKAQLESASDAYMRGFDDCKRSYEIELARSADAVQEWIPFKKRPLTDEEKQEYPDWTYIFDCPLPDDEEEILLSNGKYVWTDTFINDGECYLDGGDDIDEGMAWMPLPMPYREEKQNG